MMSTDGPTSAKGSSKKRKRLSTPSVRGDAEAAGDMGEEPREPKKPVRGGTWKNLDLILSLQDKGVPTNRSTARWPLYYFFPVLHCLFTSHSIAGRSSSPSTLLVRIVVATVGGASPFRLGE